MTHVSRKKLSSKNNELFQEALLTIFTGLERQKVIKTFSTLLTKTEQEMLRKRAIIMLLLSEGVNKDKIAEFTNTTRQTVSRIKLQLLEIPASDKSFVISKLTKWQNLKALKEAVKKILDVSPRKDILRTLQNLG